MHKDSTHSTQVEYEHVRDRWRKRYNHSIRCIRFELPVLVIPFDDSGCETTVLRTGRLPVIHRRVISIYAQRPTSSAVKASRVCTERQVDISKHGSALYHGMPTIPYAAVPIVYHDYFIRCSIRTNVQYFLRHADHYRAILPQTTVWPGVLSLFSVLFMDSAACSYCTFINTRLSTGYAAMGVRC